MCEDQAVYQHVCPSFANNCKTSRGVKLVCPKTCGVCNSGKSTMFESDYLRIALDFKNFNVILN